MVDHYTQTFVIQKFCLEHKISLCYSDIINQDRSKTVPWLEFYRKLVSAQWSLINNNAGTQTICHLVMDTTTTDRLSQCHNTQHYILRLSKSNYRTSPTSTSSLVGINIVISYPVIISGQFGRNSTFPQKLQRGIQGQPWGLMIARNMYQTTKNPPKYLDYKESVLLTRSKLSSILQLIVSCLLGYKLNTHLPAHCTVLMT